MSKHRRIVIDRPAPLTVAERAKRITQRALAKADAEAATEIQDDVTRLVEIKNIVRRACLAFDGLPLHPWHSTFNEMLARRARDVVEDLLTAAEQRPDRYLKAIERLDRMRERRGLTTQPGLTPP